MLPLLICSSLTLKTTIILFQTLSLYPNCSSPNSNESSCIIPYLDNSLDSLCHKAISYFSSYFSRKSFAIFLEVYSSFSKYKILEFLNTNFLFHPFLILWYPWEIFSISKVIYLHLFSCYLQYVPPTSPVHWCYQVCPLTLLYTTMKMASPYSCTFFIISLRIKEQVNRPEPNQ